MRALTTGTPTPVTCNRCGRPLLSAASQARGYGRTCLTKERAATRTHDLSHYSDRVAAGAEELLETPNAIRRLSGSRFVVVGRNGDLYRTTPRGCTCPAGRRGKHVCYHRVAAAVLATSLGMPHPAPHPQKPRTFQIPARPVDLAA
ncbi:DUF6011 domain-containing protein [Nocardiopsis flavescens]|uniref:DUF6011 domain-containing protein n=1 Tax=Nocardiopsis flavescens TaxID=758803 RepID=UPI00364EAF9E